jgi:hypothetical protein
MSPISLVLYSDGVPFSKKFVWCLPLEDNLGEYPVKPTMKSRPALILSLLLLCAMIGCDSSPSGPSADYDGTGAMLRGAFQSRTSTSRASRAFRAANEEELTVVVLVNGTEVARVDVVNGRFTLRGLPESFTLEFWDGSTKVGVEHFDAVKPNQELDVLLSYEGGRVSVLDVKRTGIDHQAGDGIELEGTASGIDESGPTPWDGSLLVDGDKVGIRNGQTSIREGNRSRELGDIRDGTQLHVRGVWEEVNGEMWVFAHEIKIQDDEDENHSGDTVTLCHIPPGNPDNENTITVGADAVDAHLAHGDYLGACK